MYEYDMGFIEVDALALRRVQEYGHEVRRITQGVRRLIVEIEALDVPGSSTIACQLQELIEPLQYLHNAPDAPILDQDHSED